MNVDENPATPQKYGIQGIPTGHFFFIKVKSRSSWSGNQPQEKIRNHLTSFFRNKQSNTSLFLLNNPY